MQSSKKGASEDLDHLIFLAVCWGLFHCACRWRSTPRKGIILGRAFDFLTQSFGVFYVAGASFTFAFLLYLAFSVTAIYDWENSSQNFLPELGGHAFLRRHGTSVLYWGVWNGHNTPNTALWGCATRGTGGDAMVGQLSSVSLGVNGLVALCAARRRHAYSYYVRGAKSLRLSEACEPVIGRHAKGALGRGIDLLFVVGLVGACSIGIGLAVSYRSLCCASACG